MQNIFPSHEELVPLREAARLLGLTIEDIQLLQKQQILHSKRRDGRIDFFSLEEIEKIQSNKGLTVTQEADQIVIQLQQEMAHSLSFIQKTLLFTGTLAGAYATLVIILTVSFSLFPLQTAQWLGYVKTTKDDSKSNVLGMATSLLAQSSPLSLGKVLQPIGKVSLDIVKHTSPKSYIEISKVTILDPNDILGLEKSGKLTPLHPIKIPASSSLDIQTTDVITNLNSQYLQGKKPGTNPGDIALVGESNTSQGQQLITNQIIAANLTNINLSGSAGITNSNLANSSLTVDTSGPLSGGGSVALGGMITLSCPTCVTTTSSLFTISSTDTLINKTISASLNTISNLSTSNFSSINISQWTNDAAYITTATADNLTNKTIAAGSNTITGLTNTNLSGSAGITNANLANSSLTVTTGTGLSGGGSVSLGNSISLTNTGVLSLNSQTGALNLAVGGINTISTNSGTFTITANEADTLASVTGRGATTATALTLSNASNNITVGTLTAIGGTINSTTIGATSSSSGSFTSLAGITINGLTIENNSSNVLSIASGKTLTTNNTLTFAGTDETTLTFPSSSDTIVGLTTIQTLTNKTIAAGSNTISGLSTSNFTSANISQWTNNAAYMTASTTDVLTNKTISGASNTISNIANSSLSNSSITFAGNSGSGAIALGGTLTITGAGINSAVYSGGTVTITGTEADTLSSITGRGASTATEVILNGGITTTGTTPLRLDSLGALITLKDNANFEGSATVSGTLAVNNDVFSDLTGSGLSVSSGALTVSGLTNANLSGSAGITNANLANSSLTVSAGTGLSGGGLVALGGSVSLANSGVLSLTGTSNQISISAASGNIVVSLPQNVDTGASPTFSTLNLSSNSNQLLLGTTHVGTLTWSPSTTRTLTLPDATDTLVGKATTDILTNKTLTAPAINGTVTTTGLTLPAFTASGSITGSGSPTISSFGTINGLTLTAASDGLTIAGGTTSRILTLTAGDITIGSTIKPSSSSVLAIQSNGANALFLDAGGAATVNVGTTSASAVTIGKSGVTTTINGTADANNLKIGSGTTITKHLSGTNTFDAANIALGSCGNMGTVTVTGAAIGDTVVATPTAVSGGVETLLLIWNAYVSSANTVTIRACSVATLGGQDAANQTWRADVWQH